MAFRLPTKVEALFKWLSQQNLDIIRFEEVPLKELGMAGIEDVKPVADLLQAYGRAHYNGNPLVVAENGPLKITARLKGAYVAYKASLEREE
jgi:hypothetical protein